MTSLVLVGTLVGGGGVASLAYVGTLVGGGGVASLAYVVLPEPRSSSAGGALDGRGALFLGINKQFSCSCRHICCIRPPIEGTLYHHLDAGSLVALLDTAIAHCLRAVSAVILPACLHSLQYRKQEEQRLLFPPQNKSLSVIC